MKKIVSILQIFDYAVSAPVYNSKKKSKSSLKLHKKQINIRKIKDEKNVKFKT